jgi:hypothetical protein
VGVDGSAGYARSYGIRRAVCWAGASIPPIVLRIATDPDVGISSQSTCRVEPVILPAASLRLVSVRMRRSDQALEHPNDRGANGKDQDDAAGSDHGADGEHDHVVEDDGKSDGDGAHRWQGVEP